MKSIFILLVACTLVASLSVRADYLEVSVFGGKRASSTFGDSDNSINDDQGIEIDLKNESAVGIVLAWPYDYNRQGELLFSHSETEFDGDFQLVDQDISVSYLHFGGNIKVADGLVPIFISGGIGITHFDPEDDSLDTEIRPSINFGIGSKFALGDKFSFRIDARAYGTFFDSNGYIFCSGSSCTVRSSSNLWLEGELSAGLTYRF